MLDPTGPVGHGEQRHIGLLRSTAALAGVAVEAGGNHVLPGVAATAGNRQYMVAGELGPVEPATAIQAELGVAGEQRGVGQRRKSTRLNSSHVKISYAV